MTAHYEALPAGQELHLDDHDGGDTFYRITPTKGARVDGVIAVRMWTNYPQNTRVGPRRGELNKTAPSPAMKVDLTPCYVDQRYTPNGRKPLLVNGKSYPLLYATVNFLPSSVEDYRTEWYRQATVDGQLYIVQVLLEWRPQLTDLARKVLEPLLQDIALEYVTAERWHQECIQDAVRDVDAAKKVVAEKEAALGAANDDLQKAWRRLDTAIELYAPRKDAS